MSREVCEIEEAVIEKLRQANRLREGPHASCDFDDLINEACALVAELEE